MTVFAGFLFLLFLAFKLDGVIDWSWWWVTAPLWGAVVFDATIILAWLGFVKHVAK